LRLANDFKVDLDDPIVSVIPEFGGGPRSVDGGQEPLSRQMLPTPTDRVGWTVDPATVTFRQLLTHTSGMAPWRAVFLGSGLDAVYHYPFVARPGEEFHYSDLGFMLLGEAVSRINGAPLDLAMQTLIRDRLGLDSLTYTPLRAGRQREHIAPTSFDDDWRGRRCWGEVEDENAAVLGGVAGHAGLFATAQDVARFGVAWLRRDPRLRLDRMQQTAVTNLTPEMDAARGLGWQVQPTDHLEPFGPTAYGHTGFTGTSIAIDPGRDLVVVLLTNRVYAGRTHEGIDELRTELHRVVAEAFSMSS
ncbi:MAG: serine hydrolase domain-containing protein, partial [Chloroflexota bacterium]|nr:serine hydrolase domain-containing protein [Chloroflexota bacterium]